MQTYQSTPDFYRDYIQHFNHNHSPKDGKFTSGSGGPSISSSQRRSLERAKKKDKKLSEKAEKYLTEDILNSRKKAKYVYVTKGNKVYKVPSSDSKLKIRRRTNKAAMKSAKYYSKMTQKYGEGWRNY